MVVYFYISMIIDQANEMTFHYRTSGIICRYDGSFLTIMEYRILSRLAIVRVLDGLEHSIIVIDGFHGFCAINDVNDLTTKLPSPAMISVILES